MCPGATTGMFGREAASMRRDQLEERRNRSADVLASKRRNGFHARKTSASSSGRRPEFRIWQIMVANPSKNVYLNKCYTVINFSQQFSPIKPSTVINSCRSQQFSTAIAKNAEAPRHISDAGLGALSTGATENPLSGCTRRRCVTTDRLTDKILA